jgi:hypothetical protein
MVTRIKGTPENCADYSVFEKRNPGTSKQSRLELGLRLSGGLRQSSLGLYLTFSLTRLSDFFQTGVG